MIAFGTPLFLGHCLPLRIRVRDLFDPRAWHILGGDVSLTTRRQEVAVTTFLRGTRTKKIIAPLPLHYTPRGQAMSKRASKNPRRWPPPGSGDSPRHLRPSASDQDLRRIVPTPGPISVLCFRLHFASRSIHATRRGCSSSQIRSRFFEYPLRFRLTKTAFKYRMHPAEACLRRRRARRGNCAQICGSHRPGDDGDSLHDL